MVGNSPVVSYSKLDFARATVLSFEAMRYILFFLLVLPGVQNPVQSIRKEPVRANEFSLNMPTNSPSSGGEEYRIGRDDLIEVSVFEVPDLGTVARVSASGLISVPLMGSIHAAGKTPQEMERLIEEALKKNYVNDPHVTVFIREYASQPVSIVGAVKLPGIYQLKGEKSLLEMIALAQGLSTTAGRHIQIIRRKGTVSGAERAANAETELIVIDYEELQKGNVDLNVLIRPNDIINVSEAGSIFVVGEVLKPGEYILRQGRDVTVTQALAYGGGFTREAKRSEGLIIRPHPDGTRDEFPIDMQKILSGKAIDISLTTNDILFVPASKTKAGLNRALDSAFAIVVGRAIYPR